MTRTRRIVASSAAAALICSTGVSPAAAAADPATGGRRCVTTPDATTTLPWWQGRLQPERAWPLTRGAGITVAVIDSGVEAALPPLRGRVVAGPDELGAPGGPSTSDCSGHGTLVAGLIAAAPQPGTPFHGLAPDARVLSIRQNEKVPNQGSARGDTNGMALAILQAVSSGARVINISATAAGDAPALRAAVSTALARDVVIVAAAGNDDPTASVDPTAPAPTYYPAAYPGVLAVASTGRDDQRSDTSHSGAYVGMAAPGVDITSIGPNGPGRYAVLTGTSFATPMVAGTAALVRAYRPALTQAQVVARLEATADLPGIGPGGSAVGAGIVNPYAAVTDTLPGESARAAPAPAAGRAGLPAAHPDPTAATRGRALAAGGIGLVLAMVVLILAVVLRRGRRRSWRPGRRPPLSTVPAVRGVPERVHAHR